MAVLWLACAVWLNGVGWILAATHQLNPLNYALTLLPGIAIALVWLRKNRSPIHPQKYVRRFRRPLPAIFLFLTVLVFLGGVWYAPNNLDALTYRLPRMLNWLDAGKWFWIPTDNARMNFSGAGWEWMAMPQLALAHSDRGFFLINALGFLLMPGLLFSIFRQLGVARRVAWNWMWILPLAGGFVLQAGSIGNDLTGGLLFLLSIFFAFKARKSGRATDVWLAVLAAALMSGEKLSNLPLGLPCLVAVWPVLKLLLKKPLRSLVVAALALLISAAPIMALNIAHTGSWNGEPDNKSRMQVHNPAAALLGNSLLLAEQSLMPPVLLYPKKINDHINQSLPSSWKSLLSREFPRFYLGGLGELPTEEGAGLGMGVTLLLLAGLAASILGLSRYGWAKIKSARVPLVALAAWIAALVFMLKLGSEAGPRLMLPYYPLLIAPFLLLPAQRSLLRWRAWRFVLALAGLSILPALILSPARPLWPAQAVCERLHTEHPGNGLWERMSLVYSTYANRNDIFATAQLKLPSDAHEIGLIADPSDGIVYSLWRPFGQRKVISLSLDPGHFLAHPDEIKWWVINEHAWSQFCTVPLAEWAQKNHATVVATFSVVELIALGAEKWTVLRID